MTEYCYYIPLLGFYLDKTEILVSISALLTIAVLSFTVFASTYSNFLHSSEAAWANWRLSRSSHKVYWRELAEGYRGGAQRRACSGNLSFYSLCSAIFSLILAIIYCNWYWLILFLISATLLTIAFVISVWKSPPRRIKGPLGRNLNERFWKDKLIIDKKLRQDFWDYTIHDDSKGPIK